MDCFIYTLIYSLIKIRRNLEGKNESLIYRSLPCTDGRPARKCIFQCTLYEKQGCDVYVMLKPGPLEERLRAQGIHTIPAEFGAGVTAVKTCTEQLENLNVKFDLIHFHPGLSKYSALKYGRENNIPLVETYHGMWHDDLNKHAGKLDAIVTVSEGIKLNLQSRLKRLHDR